MSSKNYNDRILLRNSHDKSDMSAVVTENGQFLSDDDIVDARTGSKDDEIMKHSGYEQALHRGLGAMMNFAFGFTEVAILSSLCITFQVGLTNGGPVVIIWGFILEFLAVMVIANCMAEICSAYPCVGSVYYWAGQLSSEEHAPLWSYITGWANFIGKSYCNYILN